ncbi:MAG: amidohydrolase family protein, partial [Planctomycetota bacterium]|nr:amidohydrolase family protein [Planctomycetota bacterium]
MNRRELLRRGLLSAAGFALPAALFQSTAWSADDPFDLVIANGTLVDGTGEKRFVADLGLRAGRIAKIGKLAGVDAKQTVDATGRIVSPGFIDIHTHSDRTLLNDPKAESGVRQGATTHVVGNCGASPAPLSQPGQVAGRTLQSYGDFLDGVRESGVSINVCGLVGHNTVREAVMGMQNRQPTEVELRKMRDLVDDAMKSGAVGLSTGLVSPPGSWSKTSEIVELARVAGRRGGMYASHMRGEASTLVDSVREALTIGREGLLPVEISHHKAAGRENWGKTRQTLPMIEAA